jgi:ABC-type amino acid transport substrate-binding protein
MSNAPARTLIAQRSPDVATAFPVEDAPSNGSGCAFRKEDIDFYGAYQKELRAMKVSGEFRAILRRYGFDTSPENESITAEQACSP